MTTDPDTNAHERAPKRHRPHENEEARYHAAEEGLKVGPPSRKIPIIEIGFFLCQENHICYLRAGILAEWFFPIREPLLRLESPS